ncbi:MAG: hypothetical protein WD750_11925 [Gammaproteobacteria bacterium]
MKENQLKTRLYLIRSLDWILFLSVLAFGIYAFLYAENRFLAALVAVTGLLIVHWVGNYTFEKSAIMQVDLDILRRKRSHQ